MGRGTSDTGTSVAATLRPRQLSDAAMDYATRQALRGLAGQAEHTAHFFGMFANDPEWNETLAGTVARVYEVAGAVEELTGQSDELVIADKDFDPRWDAISKLDRAALALWKANWTDDALGFSALSAKLIEEATPIEIAERPGQTDRFRRELAQESELRTAVQAVVERVEADAGLRRVDPPAFVLADRIEETVFAMDRDQDYQYVDFRGIARDLLEG